MEFDKTPILKISELIKDKKISCHELFCSYKDRIKKVNPLINAVVEDRFDLAEKEARLCDDLLAKNSLPEKTDLFGLPFSVKEMFAVQGMRQTMGNIHRAQNISSSHSEIVRRLITHHCIPLATTNVPELGFWFESENVVYGRTCNPYDLKKTCGGSSGGEGALIAAGGSAFGLGSDVGGSIRLPAAFCGIFGLKPTNDTTPLLGHFVHTDQNPPQQHEYVCAGPMSRHASDLRVLLQAVKHAEVTFKEPPNDLKKINFFALPHPQINLARPVDNEISECVDQVVQALKKHGVQETVPLNDDFFKSSVRVWGAAIKKKNANRGTFEHLLTEGKGLNSIDELKKIVFQKRSYSTPALATAVLEKITTLVDKNDEPLLNLQNQMKLTLIEKLGSNGILVFPCFSKVAPAHREPYLRPFDFIYSGIFNVLGLPALTVPLGLNKKGLPLAVQIVAGPYNDLLLIKVAEELETIFGGWQSPKNL